MGISDGISIFSGSLLTMDAVVPVLDVIAAVRDRRVRLPLLGFSGFSALPWSAASVGLGATSPSEERATAVRDRRVPRGRCSSSILTSWLADDTVVSPLRWALAPLVLLLRAR